MEFSTIPEMFSAVCDTYNGGDRPAFIYKKNGKFEGLTHKELREKVEQFAIGLLNLGIHARDRIGIVSENRIEWAIADLAIVSIGAIDVPIFTTLSPKQEEYIFNDAGVSAIIVSNNFQLSKVMEFKDNLPSLRHIIVMNDEFKTDDVAVKSMDRVVNRALEIRTQEECHRILNEQISKVQPDDLLTLIYTSGTTGNPKGVMLTHRNVVSNILGATDAVKFSVDDMFLTFLPWCHTYERTAGYYSAFSSGATIAFAESIESVGANIREVKPTIMTTVPKLLEMIYKRVIISMEKEKPSKKRVFYWALKIGKKYAHASVGKGASMLLKAKYGLADRLVFSKIREKVGGHAIRFVSGGAALSTEVGEFFLAAGFELIEGYGLTESSPVVSVTRAESYEIGTVGKPLFNVEVKLADDGEILVRGPNVMQGYWNDKLSTEEAIDEDGWLYTGDIGIITEKGNIRITDRKKHIFVSSGGKNIAPQPIENLLCQSPYIEQCFLIGDRREYCTALITPDFEQLKKLADSLGIKYDLVSELISNKQIIRAIKSDMDRLQKDLAKFERVRKFSLLSQPFSVENGELTPKLSIRRHVVERLYSDLIEQMYDLKSE